MRTQTTDLFPISVSVKRVFMHSETNCDARRGARGETESAEGRKVRSGSDLAGRGAKGDRCVGVASVC
jgi:hypothetical protein